MSKYIEYISGSYCLVDSENMCSFVFDKLIINLGGNRKVLQMKKVWKLWKVSLALKLQLISSTGELIFFTKLDKRQLYKILNSLVMCGLSFSQENLIKIPQEFTK